MHPTKPLDGSRLPLLALTLCALLLSLSPASAAPEKLSFTSSSVTPETISPSVNQEDPASLTLGFTLRPTDALRAWLDGQSPNGVDRSYRLSCLVAIENSASNVVRTLAVELPLSQTGQSLDEAGQLLLSLQLQWDGRDESGSIVPDGAYSFSVVQVTALRRDVLSPNGKIQDKVIDQLQGISAGVVIVSTEDTPDTTPPVLSDLQPVDGSFTKESSIVVSGRVQDESSVVVTVNGQTAALAGVCPRPKCLPL